MKSLLYLIRRHKLASALNLFGISLALAAFYLFMTQVEYSATYNHSIKDYGRTYRLEGGGIFDEGWNVCFCRPMSIAIEEIPHVENVSALYLVSRWNDCMVEYNGNRFAVCSYLMSGSGPEFFGNALLYGNIKDWQTNTSVIISRNEAKRIFGREDVIGERLKEASCDAHYDIVGVCEDFPQNCSISNGIYLCLGNQDMDNLSDWNYEVFVRLDDKANKDAVESAALEIQRKRFCRNDAERIKNARVRLVPVTDTYASGVAPQDKGDSRIGAFLFISSVLIIIVALFNFMNFSLAETPMRIRNLNTRKVMGASTSELRLGLILESVVQTTVALGIAVMLVTGFSNNPDCTNLVIGSIDFADHAVLSGVTVGAALLTGILAALYPAWYATSFKPALVLKGAFGLSPRGKQLRTAMLLLQFTVAFILTTYMIIMLCQSHYIFSYDYGFAQDEVLFSSDLPHSLRRSVIRQEVEKLPCVKSVAFGDTEPGTSDNFTQWGRGSREAGTYMDIYVLQVDENYLRTMGMGIAEGRDFYSTEPGGAWIVNRSTMRNYPWLKLNAPIGQWGNRDYDIVGVCKDFKLQSMRYDNSDTPVGFLVVSPADNGSYHDYILSKVFVRVAAGYDKLEARQQVLDAIRKTDDTWDGDIQFLDQKLQSTYEEEFRFISQVKVFTGISIAIILIGVFCLTMFETEYRRKEIAIRKIMGSSVAEVIMLFAGKYMIPLAISFIIAAPLAYNIGNQWLESFAEHTPIHWWIFPASLVSVCAVVLLTVTVQCFKVATTNPIESIRTE